MEEILKTLDAITIDGVVWIGGDFNMPDINWKDQTVTAHAYPQRTSLAFLGKMNDLGLHQMSDKPEAMR